MYKVSISPQAKKHLKEIIKEVHREAISSAIEELKENPYTGKKLTRELTGKYSFRVGTYRIIYQIFEKDKRIEILTAGHRSNIY